MSILQFIFYLGIINILFGFIWRWIFALPMSFLFAFLKINKAKYFVKAFGAYLLVSLTALLTLGALDLRALLGKSSIPSVTLFCFTGAFVLYMSFAENLYEARKQAVMEHNYELMKAFQYDELFMIAAPVLYIITLFIPIVARNPLTQWLFYAMDWIYNLPVIGWLIGIAGVLILLNVIWHGILISGLLIGSIIGKIKKEL